MPPRWRFWKACRKLQTPRSRLRRNTKFQVPSEGRKYANCVLMFEISLELGVWILELYSGIHHRQRSIENRQADDFGFGDVRAVGDPAGGEEECSGAVGHTRFFPIARKNINELIGIGMDMGGDGHSSVEFTQNRHATGLLVFVERHELDAGVGTGLPLFVFD